MRPQWEDPGPSHGGTRRPVGYWCDELAPLIEHPGRWARVHEDADLSRLYNLRNALAGGRMRIPPGRWEFTTRVNGGGGRLYARYLGPEKERNGTP